MTINWPGDVMGDTQTFVQEVFRKMSRPDEELLAILLFWRDAKLAHVEALDDSHFVDDAAKSKLFERVVPRLIRERTPDVVGLAMHTRWRAGEDRREGILVTVVGADFIRMTRAAVHRRADAPPVLEEWKPFPDSPDLEVKSWINDALRAALVDSHSPRGLSRLFRRQ
jgi:hypothetical protein